MAEIAPAGTFEPVRKLHATSCSPVPVRRRPLPDSFDECREGTSFACPVLWNKTIDFVCDEPEALRIRSCTVADAALAEIAAPPMIVTQDGSAADDPHRFHLVLLLEGYGDYRWAGGTATQLPGDVVLIDTAAPSQVVSSVDCRLVRWSFPEPLIAPFLPLRENCPVLHLPAREGLMTVLAQHTQLLAREAERLDRATAQGLLTHLCGLVGLAIETARGPRPARCHNYRAHQRQRVLSYIETHLRDPRCTAKRAARDLGMSVRWLHALLADMADGFADLVARRRLEQSLALLEDPASDHLSIAEIAFLAGFNDLSTFYRRFSECYAMTPGAARRRKT